MTVAAHEARDTDRAAPGWVLAMVIATTVLTGMAISIMVVTFPAIRTEFPSAGPAQLSWINNLFTIVTAATLVPCGVLADRVGRKRMLLAGTALFALGSVVGALAPSPWWIMVGRTVIALGAASFGPAGTALLLGAFPPERLPTAIGVWAVASGVGSAAGPSLGGIVVDHGGWPWAFWLNLPLCAFVLGLGPVVLRESRRDRSTRLPDPLGVLLVIAATSAVTLGVVQRKTDPGWGWSGARTWACFVVGAVLTAWFVQRCRTAAHPLLRLELFRSTRVRIGTAGLLVTGVAFYAVYWAFVQHAVNQWGWSLARAGVATAPAALSSGLAAVVIGRAATRYGPRPFIIIGSLGVLASGAYLWFAMGAGESLTAVLIGGTALGVASGLVAPAFISTTLYGVPAEQHSLGSALNFMAQRSSATLGTSLAITFVASSTGSAGLHQAIVISAIVTAFGIPLGMMAGRAGPAVTTG